MLKAEAVNYETIQIFNIKNFKQLLNLWSEYHVKSLRSTTKRRYEHISREFFNFFYDYEISQITPLVVDIWIENLKSKDDLRGRRKEFTYELRVLKSIFAFYREYSDDYLFHIPIRKRHFLRAYASTKSIIPKSKNLTLEEFQIFLKYLKPLLSRVIWNLFPLAILQYWHALRISEVTAIHWEDVFLNHENPELSFIRINRSLKWFSGEIARIEDGFKNSKSMEGFKDHPLFPETYYLLSTMKNELMGKGRVPTGLVFSDLEGIPFRYRLIQYYYDKAFKLSGLNYTGTHIMRHVGSRRLYTKNPSLESAQQLLGNSNVANTKRYLEKTNDALVAAVRSEWKNRKTS